MFHSHFGYDREFIIKTALDTKLMSSIGKKSEDIQKFLILYTELSLHCCEIETRLAYELAIKEKFIFTKKMV